MNKTERLQIYEELKQEVLEEFGEDLSYAEIHSVVESQFKIMMYGFSKGVGTHLPLFGKFIPSTLLSNRILRRRSPSLWQNLPTSVLPLYL